MNRISIVKTICAALAAGSVASAQTAPAQNVPATQRPVNVTIVGVNDFHGNLLPTGFRVPDPKDRTKTLNVQAGGIDTIGGVLRDIRAENPNTLFVGVGDLIGASPLISSLLRDEPTITALNQLGMAVSVLGNHEFDNGLSELMRMQKGGCASNAADKACKFENQFAGAKFPYIAANVVSEKTGRTVFPAYKIVSVGGARVAFVGAVLRSTPTIVLPSGVAGLKFTDEVESINAVIPRLKGLGVDAIVALVHQGGTSTDAFDVINCNTLSGDIVDIAKGIDPAVSVIMTGHTHRGYNCLVNGRPVIQGDAYGHLLQRVDLTIDRRAHKVLAVKTQNVVADPSKVAPDASLTALVTKAKGLTDTIANQPIATLGVEQITRTQNAAGESALGKVIADSMLDATQAADKGGAQIAFMNPGGIRAELPVDVPNPEKRVTYGDTFAVQPFGNSLVVLTMTGAQIREVLEGQFDNPAPGQNRILQISRGFAYTWDASKPKGQKITQVTLGGQPLDPAAKYRVVTNNFIADGGDNFGPFRAATDRLGGDLDLYALQDYLRKAAAAGTPIAPPAENRITRLN